MGRGGVLVLLSAVVCFGASDAASDAALGVASGSSVVANWRMNEGPAASVAQDSSGNNLDGQVSGGVQTGVVFGAATGYRFPGVSWTPPTHPEHLVQVPDNDLLNPGTGNFGLSLRFRTKQQSGNILQKGQSGMAGATGKWKVTTAS
jgi:hypothetical protein